MYFSLYKSTNSDSFTSTKVQIKTLWRRKPERAASVLVRLDCFTGTKKIKILKKINILGAKKIKIKTCAKPAPIAGAGCGAA